MLWQDISQVGFSAVIAAFLSVLIFHRFFVTSQPALGTMPLEIPKVYKRKTYRIRGIPNKWHIEDLQSFLARHEGCDDAVIKSLALETHGRSQTGTVAFRHGTEPPTTLQGSLKADIDHTFKLDVSFLGLTTLFTPDAKDHQVDIVAISGLGGHAFGSFKERGGEHMWLRDALPDHLRYRGTDRPMARIITYGFKSTVAQSDSIANLEDLATSFRESLSTLMSSRKARPFILVAHSLGGLIVKQAIITLASSTEHVHQKVIQAIYGIVFFGVPHDGMDISHLVPMVERGPNRELVESLSRFNSQILSIQQREFRQALGSEGQTEVFCFYETELSPTAQQDENGVWQINGPKVLLVTKSSATHCRPWEDGAQHICAISRSHSNMVKFGQEDDDYERVLGKLQGLAERALGARNRLRDETTKFLVPYNRNPNYVTQSATSETDKERLGFSNSYARREAIMSLPGLGGVESVWFKARLREASQYSPFAAQANSHARTVAALYAASAEGDDEIVQQLLEGGADHSMADRNGQTPLSIASSNGHLEVVKLLLEKGADPNVADRNQQTPLSIASSKRHLEVVKLLLEKGADHSVADRNRQTPLGFTSSNGYLEVVKLLLEKGADHSIADRNGQTPLSIASSNGHLEVVKLLLEKGADHSVANNSGQTPLSITSLNGHLEVVKLLLEKGADYSVTNNSGETPLGSASSNGHLEIVKLLLEKGASSKVFS